MIEGALKISTPTFNNALTGYIFVLKFKKCIKGKVK